MSNVACPPIVIPALGTESNPVYADLIYDDAESILIENPASMPAATTFKIQVGKYNSLEVRSIPAGGRGLTQSWKDLNDGTNDVAHNATADNAVAYPKFPGAAFRIVASGSVGAGPLSFDMQKVMGVFTRLL